ncbi:DUF975 domain-containing protein [Chlorogloea sp. CCALA 695]|uniref:DUF975 domain-containing protein n=1 Tax=Chlorogloea sp. CCALA 695 TaxID=2107693 RepID=UPI000D07177D|nr:DUF975 domain-containing protein [Chlorogloea sp. CCALA 695]PSB35076.1 DUF975 domain-containing protein [Chlorogloea sp. CCALA 695]
MAQSSSQPLSVGNIVTTGFQLYKNRFQPYFVLALKAYFWLLVPVYGWAKFLAISALISRLVYGELTNQPETINGGTRYVNSKMWQFLLAGLLLGLISLSVWIILLIALIIVFVVIFVSVALVFRELVSTLQQNTTTSTVIGAIILTISIIGLMLLLLRFFVLELPLAIEDNINATLTIRRSWKLTKGFESHILLIYIVTFLITLPLLALLESACYLIYKSSFGNFLTAYPLVALVILEEIIRKMFQVLLNESNGQKQIFNLLLWILSLCLSIVVGAIQLPFWQAVKAVVYYDLRTRKEGLGLKLRDRNI